MNKTTHTTPLTTLTADEKARSAAWDTINRMMIDLTGLIEDGERRIGVMDQEQNTYGLEPQVRRVQGLLRHAVRSARESRTALENAQIILREEPTA
jgi:hypothetical protein